MQSQIKLNAMKPGESATISGIHSDEGLYHRLAAMGFRVGRRIEVIRRARFHGPLHVRIGSTDLVLREKDAQQIDVSA